MDAEEYIVQILKADAAVIAITNMIEPALRQPKINKPAITYQLTSTDPVNMIHGGDSPVEFASIQVNCWADSYLTAKKLAKAVRAALTASDKIYCNNRRALRDNTAGYINISQDFEVFVNFKEA